MTNEQALFNLLKDGNWHSHMEMRNVGKTDFRARLSSIRKKLEGTPYSVIDRPGEGHTLDHKLVRTETEALVPPSPNNPTQRVQWPTNSEFKSFKTAWRNAKRKARQ